jgi:hypothetical protein
MNWVSRVAGALATPNTSEPPEVDAEDRRVRGAATLEQRRRRSNRIGRLDNAIARFLEDRLQMHRDSRLVFDDEDVGPQTHHPNPCRTRAGSEPSRGKAMLTRSPTFSQSSSTRPFSSWVSSSWISRFPLAKELAYATGAAITAQ